jgi:hypothetical protein
VHMDLHRLQTCFGSVSVVLVLSQFWLALECATQAPHNMCRFIMFILTLSIMSTIALSRSVSLPSSFLASLSFSIPGSTLYFSQGFSIPGSTLDLQHGFCAIHTVLDKLGFPVKVLPMYLHTICSYLLL